MPRRRGGLLVGVREGEREREREGGRERERIRERDIGRGGRMGLMWGGGLGLG